MRRLRTVVGVGAVASGILLLARSAYVLGNHLFEWNLNKVAIEWEATLRVSLVLAFLGFSVAAFGLFGLGGRLRRYSVLATVAASLVIWVLLSVMTARLNSGYLWLVIGFPAILAYFAVRGFQHVRGEGAT